jgi:hypothetical protein
MKSLPEFHFLIVSSFGFVGLYSSIPEGSTHNLVKSKGLVSSFKFPIKLLSLLIETNGPTIQAHELVVDIVGSIKSGVREEWQQQLHINPCMFYNLFIDAKKLWINSPKSTFAIQESNNRSSEAFREQEVGRKELGLHKTSFDPKEVPSKTTRIPASPLGTAE